LKINANEKTKISRWLKFVSSSQVIVKPKINSSESGSNNWGQSIDKGCGEKFFIIYAAFINTLVPIIVFLSKSDKFFEPISKFNR